MRSVSMGLREGNYGRWKDLLKQCETLVRDTMSLDDAIPFCDPVDRKQVTNTQIYLSRFVWKSLHSAVYVHICYSAAK